MNRTIKYLLFFAFVLASFAAISVYADDVSADTHVWDGGGADALASTPANWNVMGGPADTVPAAGDNIIFNVTSVKSCTWDLATDSFGVFSINAGYTGTITQSSDIFFTEWEQRSGVFTGVITKWLNCDGDYTVTGGTQTSYVTNLNMTSEGGIISSNSLAIFYKLTIYGNTSISGTSNVQLSNACHIYSDVVFCIGPRTVVIINAGVALFDNDGMITATTGILRFGMDTTSGATLNIGMVSGGTIDLHTYGSKSHYFVLGSNVSCSSITLTSDHATYVTNLDIKGFTITGSSLTVSARGILSSSIAGSEIILTGAFNVGANGYLNTTNISSISCGNWDTLLGTWVCGSCDVTTTEGKTIKLANGQTFHDLEIVCSTISPSVTITGVGGNIFWNFTTILDIGRSYNYFVDDIWQAVYTAPGSGILGFNYSTWSTHTFELREITLITPDAITPTENFHRHLVDERVKYTLRFAADQTVTWTLTTNADWLSWNGTTLTGTPGLDDQGTYTWTLTAANINGNVTVGGWVVVENVAYDDADLTSIISFGLTMAIVAGVIALLGRWKMK
jgi:hypothetical protein